MRTEDIEEIQIANISKIKEKRGCGIKNEKNK